MSESIFCVLLNVVVNVKGYSLKLFAIGTGLDSLFGDLGGGLSNVLLNSKQRYRGFIGEGQHSFDTVVVY